MLFSRKLFWVISLNVFNNYLHYGSISNSLENFYSHTNVYDYIIDKNKLINQLVKESYLTEYRKSELQSLKKAVEHMTSNAEQYNGFLSEDWEKCVHYRREGIMKRLNYTFAPVFIDMGDYMYYRKYRYSPFEKRKVTYLKKIAHQDFIEWLSNTK